MSRIKPTWVQIKAKLVGFLGTFNDDTDEPETKKKRIKECVRAKRAEGFVFWGRKHAILLNIPLVNHKYFVGTIILVLVHFVGLYTDGIKN